MKETLYDKLKKYAKNNPEGFTVKIENGKIKEFISSNKNRYIVSKTNYDTQKKQKEGFKNFKDGIVGGWYDKKENKYYIDKNISFADRNKALRTAKKYKQKAIFDLIKLKEIRLASGNNPVIRKNGKWYNRITGRYVAESTAKRYNSFFEKNPEGTIHQAWGGTKYKKYRYDKKSGRKEEYPIMEQNKLLRKLWYKEKQFVKTRNIHGKEVLYSPFTNEYLSEDLEKQVKNLDYSRMNGRLKIHLHRLTKDEHTVYHIIKYISNKELKTDVDFQNYMEIFIKEILPKIRTELRRIRKYHSLGKVQGIYGQMNVIFYSEIDYIPTGRKFPIEKRYSYNFNHDGIDKLLDELMELFDYYYQKFENRTYHIILIDTITFYVYSWSNEENMKYAKYRFGVKGITNGDKI